MARKKTAVNFVFSKVVQCTLYRHWKFTCITNISIRGKGIWNEPVKSSLNLCWRWVLTDAQQPKYKWMLIGEDSTSNILEPAVHINVVRCGSKIGQYYFFSFHFSTQFLANYKKNLYRIHIKVRWCRDSILLKKFWRYIPHPYISTHTCAHLCTPTHTHAHPRTPAHTRAHPRTHPHTHALPPTPTHTRAHPCTHSCTPLHTCAHPRTLLHTRTHSHTPHTYPLMSADALNLINHM